MPKIKPKGLGLPKCICKPFHKNPECLLHGRPVFTKIPTSLAGLPDDVNIQMFKIDGMWQIALYCSVLHVCLGYSDRETKIIDAIQSVLAQYAKNKGIS